MKFLHFVGITFILIVNFDIRFYVYVFLVSNMVAPPIIAIKGVHWAKDGPKFACSVDGCDASYMTKYNLMQHLRVHHNVITELGKLKHPSIKEQGRKVQDHATMNARVLNNLLVQFRHNEQKAIIRAKKHALLEWDKL